MRYKIITRYSVEKSDCGYVIRDRFHTLPLPFAFLSKSYAEWMCSEFNRYGTKSVRNYYYTCRVAGTGRNRPFKQWTEQHKTMFV